MKKKISVLLALIMILSSMSVFAISSSAASYDSFSNARKISVNSNVSESQVKNTYKYYKFTVPSAGSIQFDFDLPSNVDYFEVHVFTAGQQQLGYFEYRNGQWGKGYILKKFGVPAGDYYVSVYSTYNFTLDFKVNYVKSDYWEKEPNNSPYAANPISLNTAYSGSTNYTFIKNEGTSSGYYDYYKLTLTKRTKIGCQFNATFADPNKKYFEISVRDINGDYISNNIKNLQSSYLYSHFATDSHYRDLTLDAGTYYILIWGDECEYDFVIGASQFPDVSVHDWFFNSVNYCVDKGYFKGYADGTFGPGKNIIRQDFAVVMAKAAGANLNSQSTANLNFPDVDKNGYYAKALAWCVQNGIISGYSNGKFGPTDNITREQICVMIYNYMTKVKGKRDSLSDSQRNSILQKFPDNGAVSPWAKNAVAWSINNSVISGANGGKEIQSYAYANRAQIATIFTNMSKKGLI